MLARQIEAMAADPQALANAAARSLSVGRPHAARDLADLVERIGNELSPVAGRPALTPASPHRPVTVDGRAGMKAFGTDIGTIHFVGIGGIGMSGIAEVMHQLGYKVQGSDIAENYVVEGLRKAGIPVMIGHDADNLGDAAVVVCSTAIKDGNPEIEAAAERRLPRVRRAEMLAELMRMQKTVAVAGTHGKTTTTSMIAAMLDAGGIDPTVINGGIINRYGSNARLGKSDWMVVEADESDGSFLRLDGTIAVVTNIDPEHLEHYGSFDGSRTPSSSSSRMCPSTASRCMCVDHPEVQNILSRIRDRRVVTYGFSALADLRADNVVPEQGGTRFDAVVLQRDGSRRTIEGIHMPIPGRHNVLNALAAIAVGMELGLDDATITRGFERFDGVKRRFSRVGEVDGRDRDRRLCPSSGRDPRRAVGRARGGRTRRRGRVIAVMQPHRYTRLETLMDDFQNAFNDADIVFVTPGLCGGRGADRGRRFGGARRGAARPRPPHGQGGRGSEGVGRVPSGHRRRGRHDHLHGRRRHHQMGSGPGRRHPQSEEVEVSARHDDCRKVERTS